jgi:glycine/D-amino acid oxidase-like deaminating enzyme
VCELLATDDPRFRAVLSHVKGVANGALVCEQVLAHLERRHGDRFEYADHSPVQRIVLEADGAELHVGPHRVRARHVVLCTNGFVDHEVENRAGLPIEPWKGRVTQTVGYMVGKLDDEPTPCRAISYIRNVAIGDDLVPYVYVTARPYDHPDRGEAVGLTCVGGPEALLDDLTDYHPDADVAADVVAKFEGDVRALAFHGESDGIAYDYAWHGVMGYTESLVRWVGAEPRNPVLLYNLGCNGVGFLPSVVGGHRIARILAGEQLPASIFDPA